MNLSYISFSANTYGNVHCTTAMFIVKMEIYLDAFEQMKIVIFRAVSPWF